VKTKTSAKTRKLLDAYHGELERIRSYPPVLRRAARSLRNAAKYLRRLQAEHPPCGDDQCYLCPDLAGVLWATELCDSLMSSHCMPPVERRRSA